MIEPMHPEDPAAERAWRRVCIGFALFTGIMALRIGLSIIGAQG